MPGTVRIVRTLDGPMIEITPMPTNYADRATVVKLAELMPLRFRVTMDNAAILNVDVAEVLKDHIQAWARG